MGRFFMLGSDIVRGGRFVSSVAMVITRNGIHWDLAHRYNRLRVSNRLIFSFSIDGEILFDMFGGLRIFRPVIPILLGPDS